MTGIALTARAMAIGVRAFTRRGYEWDPRGTDGRQGLRLPPVMSATINGEAVVCSPDGVWDFDRLRLALARWGSPNFVTASVRSGP